MKRAIAILLIAFLGGCATAPQLTTTLQTCEAIKHSPKYSGKALDKAGQAPLHKWTRVVNRTLDRLGCVN